MRWASPELFSPTYELVNPMKKNLSIVIAIVTSLLICRIASANVPIGAAALLAYPIMSYFKSSALALIIAVTLESFVFHQITKYNFFKAVILILVANVISSLLGMLIVASYSSGILFFILFLPLSWLLSKMFKFSCGKTNTFSVLAKYSFGIFVVLLLVCLVLGSLLLPLTDTHIRKDFPAPNLFITTLCTACLVIIGFFLTVVTEAYAVIKYYTHKKAAVDKTTVKAVVLMNLVSYIVLSILYGPMIIKTIFR